MSADKSAEDEREPARRPRRMGMLTPWQERILERMLSGFGTVRWAAEEWGVPESTLRRWMSPGHNFYVEFRRRQEQRQSLFRAAVALANDPKASPWNRLQAIEHAKSLMGAHRDISSREPSGRDEQLVALLKQRCSPGELTEFLAGDRRGTAQDGPRRDEDLGGDSSAEGAAASL